MILKDAFRYQNFLETMFGRTANYLSNETIVMKTTRTHCRKKANPDAEDEVEDMTAERPIEFTANQLIEFMQYICNEKEKLSAAISEAKRNCGIDIDAEIANNKLRQRVASVMTNLGVKKSSEGTQSGSDYKFNAEGNQVRYYYDIKRVSTIDFDRNTVKTIAKKMAEKADNASTAIDRAMVSVGVEYEAPFNVNDTYEDVLKEFVDKTSKK